MFRIRLVFSQLLSLLISFAQFTWSLCLVSSEPWPSRHLPMSLRRLSPPQRCRCPRCLQLPMFQRAMWNSELGSNGRSNMERTISATYSGASIPRTCRTLWKLCIQTPQLVRTHSSCTSVKFVYVGCQWLRPCVLHSIYSNPIELPVLFQTTVVMFLKELHSHFRFVSYEWKNPKAKKETVFSDKCLSILFYLL